MNPVLFLAAALVLAAVPALADNGQIFDHAAAQRAYASGGPPDAGPCFDGKLITGANRAGARTLYVQSGKGPIYDLRLAGSCAALDAAEKIIVRSDGGYAVCAHRGAEVVVQTPAGSKRCRVATVRPLTSREVAALGTAARR